MPVDRNFWKHYYFVKDYVPPYKCPACGHGTLLIIDDTYHEVESGRSESNRRDPDWGPEYYRGGFCCLIRCTHDACKEVVAVSGSSEVGPLGEYGDLVTILHPHSFTPPLHFFPIPRKCPDDVALEIRAAFNSYWSDRAGGMNHLRKAVELILTHLKIARKRKTTKGKFVRLDLHRRIKRFRERNPELADRLEAVKWLGNVGSHSSEITQDDFFNACDLLEDFIHEHFDKRGKKIGALTKKVIKRKGRR